MTRRRRLYPALAYNFISLTGVALSLFALAAILILYGLSALAGESNPYVGIFIFIVFPTILVLGLFLIPLGMWLQRLRLQKGLVRPPVIDLGVPQHRNAVVTFAVGTAIFLLLTTVGLYETYHYTESVQFCGEVCHQVMKPEHTAYAASPHARVACVQCHIGPGADWYVKSKLSGARQVFKTVLGTYPRPIPTPVRDLRPAQEVCEQCHWPEKFYASNKVIRDHYMADSTNSHWQLSMLIHVGGRFSSAEHSGIHWHIAENNQVTYVASDSSRQSFDQVSWIKDGAPVIYSRGGSPLPDSVLAARRARGMERVMDCMDCHNRPAHIYKSPMEAVNEALVSGRLDPNLPWIKRQAMEALSRPYANPEEAREAIARDLQAFYAKSQPPEVVQEIVAAVQEIYAQNMFPEMNVRWDHYPDNRSHFLFPGCFRCHGSDLATPDGRTISADCNMCHSVVAQGFSGTGQNTAGFSGLGFRHPVDIEGAEREMPCYNCHIGDASLYDAFR